MATESKPSAEGLPVRHSWIANRELPGEAGLRRASSPTTGKSFAQASLLSAEQASSAIAVAQQAFPAWSALSLRQRGRHLLALREQIVERAEEIAMLVAEEQVAAPAPPWPCSWPGSATPPTWRSPGSAAPIRWPFRAMRSCASCTNSPTASAVGIYLAPKPKENVNVFR